MGGTDWVGMSQTDGYKARVPEPLVRIEPWGRARPPTEVVPGQDVEGVLVEFRAVDG